MFDFGETVADTVVQVEDFRLTKKASSWSRWKKGFSLSANALVDECGKATRRTAILLMVIDFIQLMALTFPNHFETKWEAAGILEMGLEPFGASLIMNTFEKGDPTPFLAFLVFFLLVIVFDLYIVRLFSQSTEIKYGWLQLFRHVNTVATTVLVVPALSAFVGYGYAVIEYDEIKGGKEYQAALAFLLGLLYALYSGAIIAIDFTPFTMSKSAMRRESSRLDVLHHLLRCFAVLFAVLSDSTLPLGLGATLCSCMMVISFLRFPPYVEWDLNYIRLSFFSCWGWAALSLLVQQVFSSTDRLLFYVGLPFVVALANFMILHRRHSLRLKDVRDMTHPLEMMLHVRFHIAFVKEAKRANREKELENQTVDEKDMADVSPEEYEAIENKWILASKRVDFSESSFFFVLWGCFHFSHDHNYQLGLKYFNIALDLGARPEDVFLINRLRFLSEKKLVEDSDVMAYLWKRQHLALARKYDESASASVVQFWTMLMETDPDLTKLQRVGAETNEFVDLASHHYETMLNFSSKSPRDLRMYAGFLQDLRHEEDQASQLLKKADDIETSQSKQHLRGSVNDSHLDVFDDRNAVLTISGGDETTGVVRSFNAGACNMFGYAQSEVVGKNIGMLIPSPFNELHNDYIRQFVETGKGDIIGRTQTMFALKKNGYIFPGRTQLRQISGDGDSAVFFGVMREIQTDDVYILLDENDCLMHWTQGIGKYFRDSRKLQKGQLVSSLLPNWTKAEQQRESKVGFSTIFAVEEEDFEMKMFSSTVGNEMLNQTVKIVQLKFRKLSAEDLAMASGEEFNVSARIFGGGSVEDKEDMKSEHSAMHSMRSGRSGRSARSGRSNRSNRSQKSRRSHFSHASSVQSTQASVSILRRMLLSGHGSKTSGLGRLRLYFLLTLLAVMAACVTSHLTTSSHLSGFQTSLELVSKASDRSVWVGWAATMSRLLHLIKLGEDTPAITPDFSSFLHSILTTSAARIDEIELDLFFNQKLTSAHRRLYEIPSMTLFESHYGEVVPIRKNLHDAVGLYVTKLRQLSEKTPNDFTTDNPDVFFLFNNTIGNFDLVEEQRSPMMRTLNASLGMYFHSASSAASELMAIDLSISLVSLLLLVAVLMFVFRPAINTVRKNQHKVVRVFVDLSPPVIKKLRDEALERLNRLNDTSIRETGVITSLDKQVFERTLEQKEEEADGNLHHRVASTAGPNTGAEPMLHDRDAASSEKRTAEVNQKKKKTSKIGKLGTFARFSGDRDRLILFAKLSCIFIVCAPYFITMVWWSTIVVDASHSASKEVVWAGRRRAVLREAFFYVNEFLAQESLGNPTNELAAKQHAINLANWMEYLQLALVYGDNHLGVLGSMASDKQKRLWFQEGCFSYKGVGASDGCATFDNNILAKGAAPGVEYFVNLVRKVCTATDLAVVRSSGDVNWLANTAFFYLDDAMKISEMMYEDEAQDAVNTFLEGRLYALLSMIAVLVCLQILVYSPLIRRLMADTQRTRAMLLIVPTKVIEQTKSIRDFLREHVTEM